jgi:hypothetical protein
MREEEEHRANDGVRERPDLEKWGVEVAQSCISRSATVEGYDFFE